MITKTTENMKLLCSYLLSIILDPVDCTILDPSCRLYNLWSHSFVSVYYSKHICMYN